MTDNKCPNCGYCPTCKRANPIYPPVAPQPYSFGYWCRCGMWVAYGAWHQCNTVRPWYVEPVVTVGMGGGWPGTTYGTLPVSTNS